MIENDSFIVGRNSVLEALRSGTEINCLICSSKVSKEISALAYRKKIPIKRCDPRMLDSMFKNTNHQGLAAQISPRKYSLIDDILELAKIRRKPPFIVILDHIQDPHNFGAISRTAECMGVNGIIIGKRRCVCVNSTVEKCACGALQYLKIARVDNLARSCGYLKSKGLWICGADMSGRDFNNFSDLFSGPVALVIGSEGRGISKNLKDKCDVLASIPMFGKINSLNASVAAGIFIQKISQFR